MPLNAHLYFTKLNSTRNVPRFHRATYRIGSKAGQAGGLLPSVWFCRKSIMACLTVCSSLSGPVGSSPSGRCLLSARPAQGLSGGSVPIQCAGQTAVDHTAGDHTMTSMGANGQRTTSHMPWRPRPDALRSPPQQGQNQAGRPLAWNAVTNGLMGHVPEPGLGYQAGSSFIKIHGMCTSPIKKFTLKKKCHHRVCQERQSTK